MKRLSTHPKTGKQFVLTDEMIALRDGIARGIGYVLREPCSLSACFPERKSWPFKCWETAALDSDWGTSGKAAAVHLVSSGRYGQGEDLHYEWPDDAALAAWAVDKCKPAKVKP